MSKSIASSKTIWFNLLTIIATALVAVSDSSLIVDNPVAVGGIAIATAIINLGLRLVTSQPIK